MLCLTVVALDEDWTNFDGKLGNKRSEAKVLLHQKLLLVHGTVLFCDDLLV
jgi:hypothetical protein